MRMHKLIRPLVNLASMTHVVQIDAAELDVELVKNAVIAHSQLEFGSAFKSLVWETSQSCAHLVQLVLDSITDGCRKRIECSGERRRPNLQRGSHDLFWLARRVLPGGDFAPRLV
jgi:hypothetical protein